MTVGKWATRNEYQRFHGRDIFRRAIWTKRATSPMLTEVGQGASRGSGQILKDVGLNRLSQLIQRNDECEEVRPTSNLNDIG